MAHFDTGASITNIDKRIAEYLELIPVGDMMQSTAGGEKVSIKYAVDLSFPNTNLTSFKNLDIGSCNLEHFDLNKAIEQSQDFKNFGALIGRDIMSKWLIVWNGVQSIINITD